MNKFQICDKCKKTNVVSLSKRLKEIDSQAIIDVKCHNICGVGIKKVFCIVNHVLVIADTEDELILKVKEMLHK